jgi:perosamine synthetase
VNPGLTSIPALPTFPLSALMGMRDSNWKTVFPFCSENGTWTFSGRTALAAGLPSLDLAPGTTILVPPYFHGVEIQTLLSCGYRLSFYRLDDQLHVDLDDVQRKLDAATGALYIIHYAGFPQRLKEIKRFCESNRLKLIEDCALALFSREGENWLGSVGDMAIYSVYKTMALPHGGFLVTKTGSPRKLKPPPSKSTLLQVADRFHQHMRWRGWGEVDQSLIRIFGTVKKGFGWKREEIVRSGNIDWDPGMLGLGVSSVVFRLMNNAIPEKVIHKRRKNYLRILNLLKGRIPTPPPFDTLPEGVSPLFFPVWVEDKPEMVDQLSREGVQSINLWYHSHPACPRDLAEEVDPWRKHLLEIPIHQGLSSDAIDRIADTLLRVI